MDAIYYECHITLAPVFGEELDRLKGITEFHRFKVADLLMQRHKHEKPELSKKDSFCTGRDVSYDTLFSRMMECSNAMTQNGFQVWRRKIEAVLWDEKFKKE